MANVKISEEMAVQRLPVYSRAQADLHHWAGKVLVPRGQMITPDLVAALLDAKIDFLYTGTCTHVSPEDLEAVDIYSLQENAPLSFAIFDRAGNLLAREGERLSTEQINGLHHRGQEKIYCYKSSVAGQVSRFEANYIARIRARLDQQILFGRGRVSRRRGIPISRLTRIFSGRAKPGHILASYEKFYERAVADLAAMWQKLADGGYIRNAELAPLVDEVLERFLGNRELLAALAFAQPDLSVYADHSLATAVYALFAAGRLGYSRAQARDLIVASFFHDVGYVLIPRQLLEAERVLSKGERRIIFRHIEHGLFLSTRIDWPGDDFLTAVYQHQERGTGAGYPSGYRGEQIHEYAAILAIADVLHALVSDRPHRRAYTGSGAMTRVLKMAAVNLLDRRLARIMAQELSLYPVGTCVTLSTGETARIIASSREPLAPWVGLIHDASGKRLQAPKVLNLSNLPGLTIQAEVPPFEEPLAGF